MKAGPYFYRPGPDRLGIGVENFAFERPTTIPVDSLYGAKYNVRKNFETYGRAGQFPLAQMGPSVSLRANGVYLSGDMSLSALTDFENVQKGAK